MTYENTKEPKLKVAIYIRVSTEDQNGKYGPDLQKDAIMGLILAKQETMEFAGDRYLYHETITGTSKLSERPKFMQLEEDLLHARATGERPFDVIAIYRIDRFARSLKILLEVVDFFKDHDVKILSASESIDTSTPFGKAMFSFIGIIAELERDTITSRTRAGREAAFQKGSLSGSAAPYGYNKNEISQPIIFEKEAKVVRMIFKLFTDQKYSIYEVCKYLMENKIPSPEASSIFNKKKAGEMKKRKEVYYWSPERVHYILTNEFYIGLYYGNKKKDGKLLPRSEWILSAFIAPSVVNRTVFEKAQILLKTDRHKKAVAKDGHIYLLSGLLRCDACFNREKDQMRAKWNGNRKILPRSKSFAYTYLCSQKNGAKSLVTCKSLPLPAKEMELYITNFCKQLLENPLAVKNYQNKLKSNDLKLQQDIEELERLAKVLQDIPIRRQNISQQHEAGFVSWPDFQKKMTDLSDTQERVQKQIDELIVSRASLELTSEYSEAFKTFQENYGSKLETLFNDRSATSKFIHQLVDEITVYSRPVRDTDPIAGPKKEGQLIPHKIHIKFKLPADILNDLPITSARYRSPTGAG
jgi:site-specific DNA recombinase